MPTDTNPDLMQIDWSTLPAPIDRGGARHLDGMVIPDVELLASDASRVSLARLRGRSVVFAYPRTGQPGKPALVADWDQIPGARGCTPQACAFRDLHRDLLAAGAAHVFGLSTQDSAYQREAVERLHLPFAILSDAKLELARALRLPTIDVAGHTLLERLALVIDDARITRVFYPVFPPDQNAADVLSFLRR